MGKEMADRLTGMCSMWLPSQQKPLATKTDQSYTSVGSIKFYRLISLLQHLIFPHDSAIKHTWILLL